MTALPFTILDVFAEQKFAGNPLAVFRGAGALSAQTMQSIAREINFSETTFILSDEPRDGGFDVRIFTPMEEVPFAGHPTLGTAHILRHDILGGRAEEVTLNLKVGRIPVRFTPDGYSWMKQVEPFFGEQHSRAEMAPVLGLAEDDIDARFPIQEVSTGLPFFIVPLTGLAALKKARMDLARFAPVSQHSLAKGVLVFCPEAHEAGNDLSVRVFVDYFGIPEDPATGSGNGCLAGYLVKHACFGTRTIDLRAEQGYEIGRPSLLLLKAGNDGTHIDVNVGGKSVIVARGEFI